MLSPDSTKPRNEREVLRDQLFMQDRMTAVFRESPKTVPELAEILKKPVHEVMIWAMVMWRYGKIEETGKANSEGYYTYRLKEGLK